MSNLIRGISENGGVVFCGVDSTEIVRTAEQAAHHQRHLQRSPGPPAHRCVPDGLHAQG